VAITEITLEDSFKYGKKVTKTWAKSFYFASKFLPKVKRPEIYAIYSFCRYTDNIVDENPDLSVEQKAGLLNNWEEKVIMALHLGDSQDINLKAFIYVLKKYKIEENLPLELILGMRMDLEKNRFKTFQELERYCYLVASVVGLMMIPVLGCSDYEKAKPFAIDLGKAMQITNVLRDISQDYNNNRIYIPQDDLFKFNYLEDKLSKKIVDENFQNLLKYYILQARNFYANSEKGLEFLDKQSQKAISIAGRVYAEILTEIEKQNFDIYHKRASVGLFKKISLVLTEFID